MGRGWLQIVPATSSSVGGTCSQDDKGDDEEGGCHTSDKRQCRLVHLEPHLRSLPCSNALLVKQCVCVPWLGKASRVAKPPTMDPEENLFWAAASIPAAPPAQHHQQDQQQQQQQQEQRPKRFPCPQPGCHKRFTRMEHMQRHALNHTAGEATCPRCHAHFKRPDLLGTYVQCMAQ